ncbi:hypothetical protein BCR32DRAFT_281876 [Anaeromyces robustus]|uniref:Ricin B lectin domain-containing protein n=1 Tax=Anaeromyces robustus TaxID=1754192 RepID=A0A1Y1WZC5_9FUNG|nr:hypothetical protein BCR32DRAFT_281876 [Anaeromyces robustus]|eukprot:ORX78900.1 hypothetical protein BCR32DRAFT_281876 [Anaeromyces robustus]
MSIENNNKSVSLKSCNTSENQKWTLWDKNPKDVINNTKTRKVWIYNSKLNKCLYSGTQYNYRPVISKCNKSDNRNKWEIPVSGDGYFKSLFKSKNWCLTVSNINEGTVLMQECNQNSVIKDITSSYNKESIKFSLNDNKCLGSLDPNNPSEIKLNLNQCKNSKDDQHWEIWNSYPDGNNYNKNPTKTVWIYNPKLKKCLISGNKSSYRPQIGDCNNSNRVKWEIPVSGDGYFKSLYNKKGTIGMGDCDNNSIIMNIKSSYNEKSIMSSLSNNKCLGILNSDDSNEVRLNLNKCNESKDDQQWEIWNRNPVNIINNTETRKVWIYNSKLKKCLYSGIKETYRPFIKNCINSISNEWEVPVSGDGFFKSLHNNKGWCLNVSDIDKGSIIMGECNQNSIINDITSSYNKNSITSSLIDNKCLGSLGSNNSNEIKLNLNQCDDNKDDQYWEIRDSYPVNINNDKTKTVWVYNPKLKKCLISGNKSSYRPQIGNCNNSNRVKWEIPVSGDGYFKSLYNKKGWCLHVSNIDKGTIGMGDCDNNSIIINIKSSYNEKSIMSSLSNNKYLGLLNSDNSNEVKLNLNKCNKSKDDQQWEIWDSNPTTSNNKRAYYYY